MNLVTRNQKLSEMIEEITGVKSARTFQTFKLVRDSGAKTHSPCVYFGEHDDAFMLMIEQDGDIFLCQSDGLEIGQVYNCESFYSLWEEL